MSFSPPSLPPLTLSYLSYLHSTVRIPKTKIQRVHGRQFHLTISLPAGIKIA